MNLSRFILRFFALLFLLVAIFAATRFLVRALPGDPLETALAESATTLSATALQVALGLDQPFWSSLRHDFKSAIQGDWGTSLHSREPIAPLLADRLRKTGLLTALALALALPLSLLLGLAAAQKPGRPLDRFCSFYGSAVAALPTPWIAPLLLITFGIWIPLFPVSGNVVLPAVCLALSFIGLWARLVRERVRESLLFGAAPGARARGIPEWQILLKYAFIPVSGPLVAYLGTQIGHLLTGAFIVESVFQWKGLGSLMVEAVLRRDYPLIEATTFITAATCLLGTALGDIFQFHLNERLRVQGSDLK